MREKVIVRENIAEVFVSREHIDPGPSGDVTAVHSYHDFQLAGDRVCVHNYVRKNMANLPLCFVMMPFGTKKDPTGRPDINFDSIYDHAIRPAIEAAKMQPIRADVEDMGSAFQKSWIERLFVCEFAIADLTNANANVIYELGVRHAVRRKATLVIFAKHQVLPFDVALFRPIPYDLGEGNRFTHNEASLLQSSLTRRLEQLRSGESADSPIFQLMGDYEPPRIAHFDSDVFRDRILQSAELKRELAQARSLRDLEALVALQARIDVSTPVEPNVVVDLFLSYRSLNAYEHMLQLYDEMPEALRVSVMVREQRAFALNRLKRREEALRVLEEVIRENGPSSETFGQIGRVYKDMWVEATRAGNGLSARDYLARAIDAYIQGFEADSRDAYPGINAVTLLDIRGDDVSLRKKAEIVPVVRFALKQRLKSSKPDYWDYATLLELAVLDGDEEAAKNQLAEAVARVREPWEPETTASNLAMIRESRRSRGQHEAWLDALINSLHRQVA